MPDDIDPEDVPELARDVALLAAQIADLKRSWPQDAPHLVIVDELAVN